MAVPAGRFIIRLGTGQGSNQQSDIYPSVVLYEMLTSTPFSGESPISIALKHLQEDIKRQGTCPGLSPGWKRSGGLCIRSHAIAIAVQMSLKELEEWLNGSNTMRTKTSLLGACLHRTEKDFP